MWHCKVHVRTHAKLTKHGASATTKKSVGRSRARAALAFTDGMNNVPFSSDFLLAAAVNALPLQLTETLRKTQDGESRNLSCPS